MIFDEVFQHKDDENLRRPIIYVILNKVTGKKYTGQTIDGYSRLSNNIYRLRNNTHENTGLREDYNEYGEDQFEILIEKFTFS